MAGTVTYNKVEHRSRGVVGLSATLVTDAAGAATATTVGVGFGRIVGIDYDGGLDASATVTVKDTKTGASLIAFTTGTEGTPVRFRPTTAIVDTAGTAVAAADTAPNVNRDIYCAGKLDIVVASGGNVETGIFRIIVDESGVGDLALTI